MLHIKAPGRICLFGDHQDYLGLPIIACAIDRYISLRATPNHSDRFKISLSDIGEIRHIPLRFDSINDENGNLFLAALKVLAQYNCNPTRGYDIQITGDIPINAGLSSSSALIIAWITFLLQTFGTHNRPNEEMVAKIAFEAEVLESSGPGGKMDQYSISLGNTIYLETGQNPKYKKFKQPIENLVIGVSGIPKNTAGLLRDRRDLALKAVHIIRQSITDFDLGSVKPEDLATCLQLLPTKLHPYFYAAVHNHDITQKALLEFEKDQLDFCNIGKLMSAHHNILKDYLKLTVPKIDTMIDKVLQTGAFGAKIVGSGGGGCIVALAQDNIEEIIEALMKAGAKQAYGVTVSHGVSVTSSYA